MSGWYIDTTRIFLQKLNDTDVQTIARLNPLGGGTTHHIFGYEDRITKASGYIVGLLDKEAVSDMSKDYDTHSLTGPYGNWGSYLVKSVNASLSAVLCQTLRPDLDADSPVFEFELELFKDE